MITDYSLNWKADENFWLSKSDYISVSLPEGLRYLKRYMLFANYFVFTGFDNVLYLLRRKKCSITIITIISWVIILYTIHILLILYAFFYAYLSEFILILVFIRIYTFYWFFNMQKVWKVTWKKSVLPKWLKLFLVWR